MSQPEPEELVDQACSTCGREAVMVVDGAGLCESCVHARGACCGVSEMEEE